MFKDNDFEAELEQSMEQNLGSMAVENTYGISKVAKAVGYLTEAASIFKKSQMDAEALELYDIVKKFAQYAMPEYTTLGPEWDEDSPKEMYKGREVHVSSDGRKFTINPGNVTQQFLPPPKKNKFGLSNQDVERVQLSLNKMIDKYQDGQKPAKLVPDQKWGPSTDTVFNWYVKNTGNGPLAAVKILLDMTSKNETAGGLRG